MFLTYADVVSHLNKLGLFHMDLTLERMHHALSLLDLQTPPYTIIQVVGTNGKGSTSTFLASLGKAHGLRTGLYTSPHFVSPRERIVCNGDMLPKEWWTRLGTAVYQAEPTLTYFEFLTVLAALAFAEAGVDVAVLEAGLGGRWDATTALPAQLLCMTPISMDHEKILGATIQSIAEDKADAVRPGMTVVHASQQPEVMDVVKRKAQAVGASLLAAEACASLPAYPLGLEGPHQRGNALLALVAMRTLCHMRGQHCAAAAEARGLAQAFLPGRLQSVCIEGEIPLLLDGAHNPHGLQALREALRAKGIQPSAVIFSCLGDKDMAHMLPTIREVAGEAPVWIPTIAHNERAADGAELAVRWGVEATAVPTLRAALEKVRLAAHRRGDGPVLLCGSLYLLGEFFECYPHLLQSPHAQSEDV